MAWLHLIVGVLLLTWGGDRLVSGATRVALAFNISPMVVGLTVVAFGTSMPELVTSVLAAWAGTPTLAVANILGSNVANLLLVLPLGGLISPLQVQGVTVQRDLPLLCAVSLLFAVLYAFVGMSAATGVLMLLCLVAFTGHQIVSSRTEPTPIQEEFEEEVTAIHETMPASTGGAAFALVVGLLALVAGGHEVVEGAVEIARAWGITERVIGLTIVAVGTSAPEIATTLAAVWKGENDVAVGNAVGSNLFNLLGIGGALGLLAPGPGDPALIAADAPIMVIATLLASALLWRGSILSRPEAAVMLTGYIAYIGIALFG